MAYAVKSVTIMAEMLDDPHITPEDYLFKDVDYQTEDQERLEAWKRADWYYVGIRAVGQVEFMIDNFPAGSAGFNTITSMGLWGIESDSDPSYFAEVYADEVSDLKDRLKALGIGDELITVRPWS